MASTLAEINYLAGYPGFRSRVESAMTKAAISISYEADAGDTRSQKRKALSYNVLNRTQDWPTIFALAVAVNVSMELDSLDGDIENVVSGVWDAIAGAPPAS
jgi:hypothetical protein